MINIREIGAFSSIYCLLWGVAFLIVAAGAFLPKAVLKCHAWNSSVSPCTSFERKIAAATGRVVIVAGKDTPKRIPVTLARVLALNGCPSIVTTPEGMMSDTVVNFALAGGDKQHNQALTVGCITIGFNSENILNRFAQCGVEVRWFLNIMTKHDQVVRRALNGNKSASGIFARDLWLTKNAGSVRGLASMHDNVQRIHIIEQKHPFEDAKAIAVISQQFWKNGPSITCDLQIRDYEPYIGKYTATAAFIMGLSFLTIGGLLNPMFLSGEYRLLHFILHLLFLITAVTAVFKTFAHLCVFQYT